MNLRGKVFLITGSSRGIGAATAKLAIERGAVVILHGRTCSETLLQLANELNSEYVVFDVADQLATKNAIEKVAVKFGRIDALVNAAGIVRPKKFLDLVENDFHEEFSVNILGTIYAIQAVIPVMKSQGAGRIVNVSSIRGMLELAAPRGVAYSITKAAVNNLTTALAKELAPEIAVNSVAPGFTETDMADSWDDNVRRMAKSSLLGRPANPREIASSILFLASEDAAFITGQTILVDGGYSISGK